MRDALTRQYEIFCEKIRAGSLFGDSECLNLEKKEIFIRDLTIDFNADRNQNEKRFTIGEHNGEEWVRKPKSIILNQARESSSTERSMMDRPST